MIIDKMESIRLYADLLPNLENGLKAVDALETYEVGRCEFEGGYFMVQEGTTHPLEEGNFEVHRNYIDVQIILEGSEEVGWQHLSNLISEIPYSPEKDAEFLKGNPDHVMKISAGMFWVGFTQDGHKPCCHTKEQQNYKKIVMKLPVK